MRKMRRGWPPRSTAKTSREADVALTYAHRCAIAFVASGCALGALCGLAYDVMRNRRTGG